MITMSQLDSKWSHHCGIMIMLGCLFTACDASVATGPRAAGEFSPVNAIHVQRGDHRFWWFFSPRRHTVWSDQDAHYI